MKKSIILLITLLGICSCGPKSTIEQSTTSEEVETTTEMTTEEVETTTEEVETTTEEVETTTEEVEITTEEVIVHSPFYIEGYSVEDVITYFTEVVLDSEYSTGEGNSSCVQKWLNPIQCVMYGDGTQKDKEVLLDFFEKLNQIEGFPGITMVNTNEWANIKMYFLVQQDFNANFGNIINYELADGAVEYWYWNDTNELFEARIGYRSDIDQSIRNAVLLEEVINGLGMANDTILREDSIIYQYFNEVQDLSEMDWLILKLLYHPNITCGMDYESCSEVIRGLYY